MSKRTSRIAGVVAATALLLTGFSAQTASADPPCESGKVCAYYQGSLVASFWPVYPGDCRYISHQYDRLTNLSGITQRAWSGTNCTGRNVAVGAGTGANVNYFWSVGGN